MGASDIYHEHNYTNLKTLRHNLGRETYAGLKREAVEAELIMT